MIKDKNWNKIDPYQIDEKVKSNYYLEENKNCYIYDKWGWVAFMAMNETNADIFESEVDRLIKEGNT